MAENRENNRPPPLPRQLPIKDYLKPVVTNNRQPIPANNFELKPALINMVQQNQFGGSDVEDPNLHLRIFLEIADTVKMNGVPEDIVRMRLFPFSLRDQARSWLQSQPFVGTDTWEDLASKFLSKFFPPAKSAQLRSEISTFKQFDSEQLFEAWERFKDLLRRCHQHNYENWVQIQLFYNGLNGPTRIIVDAASGGTLFAKTADDAFDLLEQMSANSFQWPSERAMVRKPAGK